MPRMCDSYEIVPFTEEVFFEALSNGYATPLEVSRNARAEFLVEYLTKLRAKTIVVEHDYTDGDYLEDYVAYYSRCFAPYERKCKRLHFFTASFSVRGFRSAVQGVPNAERRLQDSYIGFIVSRPLPEAQIGRTILQTYPEKHGRNFTCTHEHDINLLGLPLKVRGLPFQEQDSVLAACATVALWSALHRAAKLFGTPSPRPAEITRVANGGNVSGRPIPSHGLNVEQICQAIRNVNLEPEVYHVRQATPLASLLYGYLRQGFPLILGVRVSDVGLHAVSLNGYYQVSERVVASESGATLPPPSVALRCKKFYAHDDQRGPHARIWLTEGGLVRERLDEESSRSVLYPVKFGTYDQRTKKELLLLPKVVIVPTYTKVRVTFLEMWDWVTQIDGILSLVVPSKYEDREWDVHLTTTNELKASLRSRARQSPAVLDLLLRQHPRFIWRATLSINAEITLDVLVDATDMARSVPFYHFDWHSEQLALAVNSWMPALTNMNTRAPRLIQLMQDSTTSSVRGTN